MAEENVRPLIGITMGDAAGVGPEIIVKALNLPETYADCRPLVIGDLGRFQLTVDGMQLPLKVRQAKSPSDGVYRHATIDVLQLDGIDVRDVEYAKAQAASGA